MESLFNRRHLCKLSSFLPITKDKCVCAANDYASRLATIRRLYCPREWTIAYKFVFMQLTDMNVFAEKDIFLYVSTSN